MDKCEWIGPNDERCDEPSVEGKSYCKDHVWLMYQQGTALGKRNKDKRTAEDVHLWESLINDVVNDLIAEGYTF